MWIQNTVDPALLNKNLEKGLLLDFRDRFLVLYIPLLPLHVIILHVGSTESLIPHFLSERRKQEATKAYCSFPLSLTSPLLHQNLNYFIVISRTSHKCFIFPRSIAFLHQCTAGCSYQINGCLYCCHGNIVLNTFLCESPRVKHHIT